VVGWHLILLSPSSVLDTFLTFFPFWIMPLSCVCSASLCLTLGHLCISFPHPLLSVVPSGVYFSPLPSPLSPSPSQDLHLLNSSI
jgi:hypothetical protein